MLKSFALGMIAKSHKREINNTIDRIEGYDLAELGCLCAIVTHLRNENSFLYLVAHDRFALRPEELDRAIIGISQRIKVLQKSGNATESAGWIVWLHTLRALSFPENRFLGKRLWKSLERGFPYVADGAAGYGLLTGGSLNTDNFDTFPDGLDPHI